MQAYADKQTELYKGKAKKADRDFVGVAEGQVGPVEARLAGYGQVRGLVFGAFGEASEAVHEFVQVVAQAKAAGGPGRAGGSRGEVAKLVGQVRMQLGVTAVKAQARLLLERVRMLGEGTASTGDRQLAKEQEAQRQEAEAAATAAREGRRGVHQGGQPLVRAGA